jgi:pimeloyl-ACP methyl ester carboxylesterase
MPSLSPLLALYASIFFVQMEAPSAALSDDRLEVERRARFLYNQRQRARYADLYGEGDRGVVLAHGGRFSKESWQPQAHSLAKAGFQVLAFDFRGFGKSHGPGDSDIYTAPVELDVLAAVGYLRKNDVKTVSVMGGSFGGSAAADASRGSQAGEINRLILLAAKGNGPAERIKSPLLIIVARDDADEEGLRLPRIRDWFDKAPPPKSLSCLTVRPMPSFSFKPTKQTV